ncbi:hypothetical protein G6O67_002644 [Ophiocordyceps sinensis]|uniref:Uncharacterized protein n=2 Tax=Ophiocordyceps sinensis TaxID=72228 RepID=A0A8H4PV02_9HYPO|nr:hypothetical protein OCS_04755 [Ophiocordyceps sinensis CO18]KAF4510778.1 hypothetical protein G6O67_002644 [Ophiocordyceps sinensis]
MQRPPCNAAVGSESPILLVLWTRACVVSADMAIHHRQGHGLKRQRTASVPYSFRFLLRIGGHVSTLGDSKRCLVLNQFGSAEGGLESVHGQPGTDPFWTSRGLSAATADELDQGQGAAWTQDARSPAGQKEALWSASGRPGVGPGSEPGSRSQS